MADLTLEGSIIDDTRTLVFKTLDINRRVPVVSLLFLVPTDDGIGT